MDHEDRAAMRAPFSRQFFISSVALGQQLLSQWTDRVSGAQQAIDAHLSHYPDAATLCFRHGKALGLLFSEPPAREGWSVEPLDVNDTHYHLVTPDIRFEAGKRLREDLTAIDSLNNDKPAFGPFAVTALSLENQGTLRIKPDSEQVLTEYPLIDALRTRQLIASIPIGGADALTLPDMPACDWLEIDEDTYARLIQG